MFDVQVAKDGTTLRLHETRQTYATTSTTYSRPVFKDLSSSLVAISSFPDTLDAASLYSRRPSTIPYAEAMIIQDADGRVFLTGRRGPLGVLESVHWAIDACVLTSSHVLGCSCKRDGVDIFLELAVQDRTLLLAECAVAVEGNDICEKCLCSQSQTPMLSQRKRRQCS
jgi:hypothetical protein